MDLAQAPQLTPDAELRPGVRLAQLWTGPGTPPLEVGELSASGTPSDTLLRECWQARLRGRAVPLLLFIADAAGHVVVCGPDQGTRGEAPGIAHLSVAVAETVLRQVLALPAREAVPAYLGAVARSQGSGGVPGLRNRQLLSTHYLTAALRRQHAPQWPEWAKQGAGLAGLTGAALFRRMEYSIETRPHGELLLGAGGLPVAVAHVYAGHSNLDRMLPGPTGERVQPSALALATAHEQRLDYAFLQAGPALRLHRLRPAEAFEESAAPAAFVEFDLSLLPSDGLGVLWALCAAEAVAPAGRLSTSTKRGMRDALLSVLQADGKANQVHFLGLVRSPGHPWRPSWRSVPPSLGAVQAAGMPHLSRRTLPECSSGGVSRSGGRAPGGASRPARPVKVAGLPGCGWSSPGGPSRPPRNAGSRPAALRASPGRHRRSGDPDMDGRSPTARREQRAEAPAMRGAPGRGMNAGP